MTNIEGTERKMADDHIVVARAADWLGLAAAPTFALLALMTAWLESGPLVEALCGGAALNSMATMYWLMSVFHAGPWLRLIARMRRV
jgi:hypothetical protein